MSARTFVDTNVLVRLFDPSSPAQQRAATLRLSRERATGGPTVSPVVLGEVYHALTKNRRSGGKPLAPILDRRDAVAAVRTLARLEVRPVTVEIWLAALTYLERPRSFEAWDALHLATAVAAGCDTLLTWDSDFRDGERIDGVRIEHLSFTGV